MLFRRIARSACGLAVIVSAAAFASCAFADDVLRPAGPSVLDPAGPVGAAQRTILLNSLLIMLAIVVPTILATLGFAWWFRASNTRAVHLPNWSYSGQVELVTWAIPILVILFLGGITWIGSHDLDPAKPLDSKEKPLVVQVVAMDWKWLFILPEQGVASVNELTVPTGRPLDLRLSSSSVMNAFFVPRLGSMIYVMNGMSSRLHLQADQAGDYHGLSSHFSGDGFPGMHFQVHAVEPAAFETWAAATRGSGPTLDRDAYMELARQSQDVKPFTYGGVQDGLYDAVVTQEIPPADGPTKGDPSVDVFPRTSGAKSLRRSAAICTPARPAGRAVTAANDR